VLRTTADLHGRLQGRPGRNPDRNAFQPRYQARIGKGVLVGNRDHLVIDLRVEYPWRKAGPDALNLVRSRLAARKDRRILRLDGDHMERRLAGLQRLADAGDGAAGADSGDEDVDIATGVVPDFLGRGAAVDIRVGR